MRIIVAKERLVEGKKEGKIILNTKLLKDEDCNEAIFTFREINKWILKDTPAIERWNKNVKGWTTIFKTTSKRKAM